MGFYFFKTSSVASMFIKHSHTIWTNEVSFPKLPNIFQNLSKKNIFHEHSRFTGQQGKGEANSLTRLYHFHPLHRHLDSSRAITADSSPLHIASRLKPGIFGFRAQVANH